MKAWYAVEHAGYYMIKDGPHYEDNNVLDGEVVGFDQAQKNAELAASAPELLAQLTYERQRRIAAERVIDNELNGAETYEEATRNLLKWQEIVNQQPRP